MSGSRQGRLSNLFIILVACLATGSIFYAAGARYVAEQALAQASCQAAEGKAPL